MPCHGFTPPVLPAAGTIYFPINETRDRLANMSTVPDHRGGTGGDRKEPVEPNENSTFTSWNPTTFRGRRTRHAAPALRSERAIWPSCCGHGHCKFPKQPLPSTG